jgi:hypothetical protein
MQEAKYKVYLARASHAEDQAAKTKDASERALWVQAAREYRKAAREIRGELPLDSQPERT